MPKRVRVRRERPSALSWAVALAVTMLAVYLVTLGALRDSGALEEEEEARVSAEIALASAEVHFAALGSHADEAEARVAAAEYALRGAAGRVFRQGDAFVVLTAGYENLADAERIAAQLGAQEGVGAQALSLSAPGATLKVTAGESTVRALEGADSALREQLALAASLALQTDRGELTPASARMLAAVSESELKKAYSALEGVEGAAESPVAAGLMRLLARLADNFGAASEEGRSAAALAGRLRLCHVDGWVELIRYLNGLCG